MKKYLILIPNYGEHSAEELDEICGKIRERAGDVIPFVAEKKKLRRWQLVWLFRPSFFCALCVVRRWEPLRGHLLQCVKISKNDQFQRIKDAGIDCLMWTQLRPGLDLDPAEWGPLVVIKPEGGLKGMDVKLCRTNRVRWDEAKHGDREWLVQEMAYTGPVPVSYRVMTFCGRMLYMERSENVGCGNLFEEPDNPKSASGHNIVASSRKGRAELVCDKEIADFAEQVAESAFPDVSVLGLDIMRDIRNGRLCVAEVNPRGLAWHFSSKGGKQKQREFGYSYAEQFGAYDIAADRLIEMTRCYAR